MILRGNRRRDNCHASGPRTVLSNAGSISMLDCLTMCELSVGDEEQQSEKMTKRMCNDWNGKIENWVQNERTDCHKCWNSRIWHSHWIQIKLTGGHNIWSRNWQDDGSQHGVGVDEVLGVRSDDKSRLESTRQWCGTAASSKTMVQMSLGRRSRSTVLERNGKSVVWNESSMSASVQRCRRQVHEQR